MSDVSSRGRKVGALGRLQAGMNACIGSVIFKDQVDAHRQQAHGHKLLAAYVGVGV